jgi:16S rRNA G966 N2-methylase RsmD
MRVISGTARRRTLRAAAATRPTADLIKGVIYSMLEALA